MASQLRAHLKLYKMQHNKEHSWKYPGNQDLHMAKLSEVRPSSAQVYIERMANAYESAISSTCHRHDVS